MVLFACGETLLPPSVPAPVNDLAPDDLRGRYNGMYALAWTVGFMVGPAVAGAALGAELATPLFAVLIGTCGAIALVARMLERRVPAEMNRIPSQLSVTTTVAATD
jgi:MFS family permease